MDIDNIFFLLYNKIMETNEQIKAMESNVDNISNNQIESIVDYAQVESCIDNKQSVNCNKKPLTPYQKYKNSRNQNGKKYFDFYDDVKVYTHNIWDW